MRPGANWRIPVRGSLGQRYANASPPSPTERLLLASLLRQLSGVQDLLRCGASFGESFASAFVKSGTDAYVDGKTLPGVSFVNSTQGRHVAIIAPASDADVTEADRLPKGGIEADPAAIRKEGLDPRMGRLPSNDFLLLSLRIGSGTGDQITGNVAGGQAPESQDPDEHVGEILADARA